MVVDMEMNNKLDLLHWLKLSRVPKLGPKRIQDLFGIFRNTDNILSASDEDLLRTRIFNEQMIQEWNKLKNALDDNFLQVIEECKKNEIDIIPIINDMYPYNLKRIPYPPKTLFLSGDTSLLKTRKVAIVGTRKAGEVAKKWTFENAKLLAKNNITVVSGGAIGIDTAAHKGALDVLDGKTICVLGSGFFKMYPEENISLFKEISKKGLLISEHLPKFPGSRISLIQRNRITSGLSDALIMVSSGKMGGSMVQTKMAFEQRVPIFCPKISLGLEPTEGIRQIIQEWGGKEIESAREVIDFINKNESESKIPQYSLNEFAK